LPLPSHGAAYRQAEPALCDSVRAAALLAGLCLPPWADKARVLWGRAVEKGCRNGSARKRGGRSMGAWDLEEYGV